VNEGGDPVNIKKSADASKGHTLWIVPPRTVYNMNFGNPDMHYNWIAANFEALFPGIEKNDANVFNAPFDAGWLHVRAHLRSRGVAGVDSIRVTGKPAAYRAGEKLLMQVIDDGLAQGEVFVDFYPDNAGRTRVSFTLPDDYDAVREYISSGGKKKPRDTRLESRQSVLDERAGLPTALGSKDQKLLKLLYTKIDPTSKPGQLLSFSLNPIGDYFTLSLERSMQTASSVYVDRNKKRVESSRDDWEMDPFVIQAIRVLSKYSEYRDYTVHYQTGPSAGTVAELAGKVKQYVGEFPQLKTEWGTQARKKTGAYVLKRPDEVTWYHATLKQYVQKIKREGLKPGKVTDDVRDQFPNGMIPMGATLGGWSPAWNADKQRAVYLTRSLEHAEAIARTLSSRNDALAVVLQVDGKALADVSKLLPDEDAARADGGPVNNRNLDLQIPPALSSVLSSGNIAYGDTIPARFVKVLKEIDDREPVDEAVQGVKEFLGGYRDVHHFGRIGWFDTYWVGPVEPTGSADKKKIQKVQLDSNSHGIAGVKLAIQRLSALGAKRQKDVLIIRDLSAEPNPITGGGTGGWASRAKHAITVDTKLANDPESMARILAHEWAHKWFFNQPKHVKKVFIDYYEKNIAKRGDMTPIAAGTLTDADKTSVLHAYVDAMIRKWKYNKGADPNDFWLTLANMKEDEHPDALAWKYVFAATQMGSVAVGVAKKRFKVGSKWDSAGVKSDAYAKKGDYIDIVKLGLGQFTTEKAKYLLQLRDAEGNAGKGGGREISFDDLVKNIVPDSDKTYTYRNNGMPASTYAEFAAADMKSDSPLVDHYYKPRIWMGILSSAWYEDAVKWLEGKLGYVLNNSQSDANAQGVFGPDFDDQFLAALKKELEAIDQSKRYRYTTLRNVLLNALLSVPAVWKLGTGTTKDQATWTISAPAGAALRAFIKSKGLVASDYGAANVDELFATTVEYASDPKQRGEVNKNLRRMLTAVFSGTSEGKVDEVSAAVRGVGMRRKVEDQLTLNPSAGELQAMLKRYDAVRGVIVGADSYWAPALRTTHDEMHATLMERGVIRGWSQPVSFVYVVEEGGLEPHTIEIDRVELTKHPLLAGLAAKGYTFVAGTVARKLQRA
jgi:hypothetical protein